MHILELIAVVLGVVMLFTALTALVVVYALRHSPAISEYEDVQAIVSSVKDEPISDDVCGFCHNSGIITGIYKNIPCSCAAALKRGLMTESRDIIDVHC